MRRLLQQRRWRVATAAALALVLAAGGLAYWTASGSGTATASVTSPDEITLTPGAPTAYLYPGISADVAVKVTNPNTFQVHVPSLVLDTGEGDGGFAVDGGHSGCDLSALSYTTQNNSGSGWNAPASADLDLDLANAISMATSAANDCQGATFTVYLAVGS